MFEICFCANNKMEVKMLFKESNEEAMLRKE